MAPGYVYPLLPLPSSNTTETELEELCFLTCFTLTSQSDVQAERLPAGAIANGKKEDEGWAYWALAKLVSIR